MRRNIIIDSAAGKPQTNESVDHSTPDQTGANMNASGFGSSRDGYADAEDPPEKTTTRRTAPNKPTHPMKRHILTIASALTLPICAFAADDKKKDADNTAKNVRDRDNKTITPGDQSEKPEDRKLTQAIRQAVMKDKSLTMTAKNVKIITALGKVTLRGPVNTEEEKTKINDLAKAAAGQVPVDNQLEVKAAK